MEYDPYGEEEDDWDEEDEWFVEHGVPTQVGDDGNYYFQSTEHMLLFVESRKRDTSSQKQEVKQKKRVQKVKFTQPVRTKHQVHTRMYHYRR